MTDCDLLLVMQNYWKIEENMNIPNTTGVIASGIEAMKIFVDNRIADELIIEFGRMPSYLTQILTWYRAKINRADECVNSETGAL